MKNCKQLTGQRWFSYRILAVVLGNFVDLGIAAGSMFAVVQLPVGILPAAGCTENFLTREELKQFGYRWGRYVTVHVNRKENNGVKSVGLELIDKYSVQKMIAFCQSGCLCLQWFLGFFEQEGSVYLYTSLNKQTRNLFPKGFFLIPEVFLKKKSHKNTTDMMLLNLSDRVSV